VFDLTKSKTAPCGPTIVERFWSTTPTLHFGASYVFTRPVQAFADHEGVHLLGVHANSAEIEAAMRTAPDLFRTLPVHDSKVASYK
jgi:hypothetical protein